MNTLAPSLPPAPATFLGVQCGYGITADIELWNLKADIPGHPVGSSVARQTLEAAGYIVPPAPQIGPHAPRPARRPLQANLKIAVTI